MSSGISMPGTPTIGLDAPHTRPPENVQEAAKQFEALLISQMLKQARGDEEGWLGGGGDAGSDTATALAEEQFSLALAHSGGLGLSAKIVASLAARIVIPKAAPIPKSAA